MVISEFIYGAADQSLSGDIWYEEGASVVVLEGSMLRWRKAVIVYWINGSLFAGGWLRGKMYLIQMDIAGANPK